MARLRGVVVALIAVLAACGAPAPGGGPDAGAPVLPACDAKPPPDEATLVAQYARDVHPLLETACASCHAPESRRAFRVLDTPAEAFAWQRVNGWWSRDAADSIPRRLLRTDDGRMPPVASLLTGPEREKLVAFACEVGSPPPPADAGTPPQDLDAGTPVEPGPTEACAERPWEPLHAHAIRYATTVHPLLVNSCLSCHSLQSGRGFLLSEDPVQAFSTLWADGRFRRNAPDGLLARVTATGAARMPQGGAWSADQIAALDAFTCGLARYEMGETPDAGTPPGDGAGDAGTPDADAGTPPLTRYTASQCPAGNPATLEEHADRFAREIQPLLTRPRESGGCISCHAMDSGRVLRVDDDGAATFYRLRSANLLDLSNPASMLFRVAASDASAMPPGGPGWSEEETDRLFAFTCDLLRGPPPPPPDEVFPPELLQPWTGGASTDYDNTTLTYEQLKGRIRVQFGDSWIRNGVDQFALNIARFGGVDFTTSFVPQKQLTADYLLGLDALSADVCGQAAGAGTGPFAGLDLGAPVVDEPPSATFQYEVENATISGETALSTSLGWTVGGGGRIGSTSASSQQFNPRGLNLWSNYTVHGPYAAPLGGTYRVTVRARGQELPPDLPRLAIVVNGTEAAHFGIPADADPTTTALDWSVVTADVHLDTGTQDLGVAFTNDAYKQCPTSDGSPCGDRNLLVDWVKVEGPLPGTTAGAPGAVRATKDRIGTLLSRVLLRPAQETLLEDEVEPLYELLLRLETIDGDRTHAWAGLCEGLLQHQDFLFTRRPSAEGATGLAPERALFVRTALDLLDRPPTPEETSRFDAGTPRETFIDEWLASGEFRTAYYKRVRLLLESDGSLDADEPAKLWLYLAMNDGPIRDLLTADYTTRATLADLSDLAPAPRFSEYGATGLLVMKGYLRNKPGLPHYNYAARVLSDFLGHVFEVPPDIVDSRAGSTPTSTVQQGTVCFSCHQLLTPLSHQRLGWYDDGLPRLTDASGAPIDDSDRNLVPSYPYRGKGMAAFAAKAVKKERFLRRMANSQVEMLLGRPMRAESDERDLYQSLWATMNGGAGSFRSILKAVLVSPEYTRTGVAP